MLYLSDDSLKLSTEPRMTLKQAVEIFNNLKTGYYAPMFMQILEKRLTKNQMKEFEQILHEINNANPILERAKIPFVKENMIDD